MLPLLERVMKPSVLVTAVLGLITAVPATALAQDQAWLKDRAAGEGAGIRAGDFELHPGAGLMFGYDSNYLRRGSTDFGGPLGALRLQLVPSLSVSTLTGPRSQGASAPTIDFRGGIALTYNEFIPLQSREADAIRGQRNLGGSLDFNLGILRGRQWSGQVFGSVARQLTASEEGIDGSFNRDTPIAGAEIGWAPGAGLFDWHVRYTFSGVFFESSEFSNLNNITNEVSTQGRWRFLPRTALVYDARFGFTNYPSQTTSTTVTTGSSALDKTSAHPLRARLGVTGLVTPSFAASAMVGWGASFYSNSGAQPVQDFDSVIGQVELKWYLTSKPSTEGTDVASRSYLSSIAVGFQRDFFDSYIGTYYERDWGYLTLSNMFSGTFLLLVSGGVGPYRYPSIASLKQAAFTDVHVDTSLFGEYRFKDSLGVNLTLHYTQNISNTTIATDGLPDELAYKDLEAYIGFRWFL